MCYSNILIVLLLLFSGLNAKSKGRKDSGFWETKKIESTAVKQQFRSNTCWSFSVLGMIETEILKEKNEVVNLSEMYVVYLTYIEKARHYLRMHGKTSFSGGGMLNDPLDIIEKYGIIPKESYPGISDGKEYPDHTVMDLELKVYMDSLVASNRINDNWLDKFTDILDKYMGKLPADFKYKGAAYTPLTFKKKYEIECQQYVALSSFMYKPFYTKFMLEVPDNWASALVYNLPLDSFINQVDYSMNNGFPVAVTMDITEKGFDFWNHGIAIIDASDTLDGQSYIPISETLRQQAFDNYETTDDHALLLTGIAYNKYGKKFYLAKNSWGTKNTCYEGYLYLSEKFLRYKVIAAMINKKSLLPHLKANVDPCILK